MRFELSIFFLGTLATCLSVPVFEYTATILILLPVLIFLLGYFVPLSTATVGGTLFILIVLSVLIFPNFKLRKPSWKEAAPSLVFMALYAITYQLATTWPDFYPLGERLRDYAILQSISQHFHEAREPWMAGANLNYYLYWYRFGIVIQNLLQFSIADTYHFLVSFSLSFFGTGVFTFLLRVLGFSVLGSFISTILIIFGTNLAGVWQFYLDPNNWWAPSRVVKGAINEFPAWSFILGDVHPHYLNLSMLPLALILGFDAIKRNLILYAGFVFVIAAWAYSANIWDLPLITGLLTTIGLFLVCTGKTPIFSKLKRVDAAFISIFVVSVISLYLSSRNIIPLKQYPKLITPNIPTTTISELFLHFGFFLSLLSIATCALFEEKKEIGLSGIAITLSLLPGRADIFLAVILIVQAVRITLRKKEPSEEALIIDAMSIVSILYLLIVEFVFLDDPYGGESERMNTIFKVYNFVWFPLAASSFALLRSAYNLGKLKYLEFFPRPILQGLAVFIMLSYFVQMVTIRAPMDWKVGRLTNGLTEVNKSFSGSRTIIEKLQSLPEGITIEAQGNPYDWTSFVSTLGQKEAFLGWANHVNLLTEKYEEVSRRETLTKEFYEKPSCEEKKKVAVQENIKYVVFGNLERKKYPSTSEEGFGCFKLIASDRDYRLFQVG